MGGVRRNLIELSLAKVSKQQTMPQHGRIVLQSANNVVDNTRVGTDDKGGQHNYRP